MLNAASYYENKAKNLGVRFLKEIRNTIDSIAENPKSGNPIRGNIRRKLVNKFPFGIFYRIDPEEIVIIAIMHLRRHPDYWIDRVR